LLTVSFTPARRTTADSPWCEPAGNRNSCYRAADGQILPLINEAFGLGVWLSRLPPPRDRGPGGDPEV